MGEPGHLPPEIADNWFPVAMVSALDAGRETMLLDRPITVGRDAGGPFVVGPDGVRWPVIERFGHLWTSPGKPAHDLFTIPEADAPGRRLVDCGSVMVRTRPKKGFDAASSSLKSPRRMASLGTMAVLVFSWRKKVHSWLPKKKSLSRPVLNLPGITTGPPMV